MLCHSGPAARCPAFPALAALLPAAFGMDASVHGTKVTLRDYRSEPNDINVHARAAVFTLVHEARRRTAWVLAGSADRVTAESPTVHLRETVIFQIAVLRPGRYQVGRDLPGHRRSGVQATLTAT